MRHIYSTKGLLRGFYAGALPNMTRLIARNSYKFPLLVGLPEWFKTNAPQNLREHPAMFKLATGVSVALIESLITCPIDRTKVYMMTMREGQTKSYTHYYKHVATSDIGKVKELFRGFGPLFVR